MKTLATDACSCAHVFPTVLIMGAKCFRESAFVGTSFTRIQMAASRKTAVMAALGK
jgi:hypothetical protein